MCIKLSAFTVKKTGVSELLVSAFSCHFCLVGFWVFFFSMPFGTYFLKVSTILKTTKIWFGKLGFHCKPVWKYILSCTAVCTEITKQNVVMDNMNFYFGEVQYWGNQSCLCCCIKMTRRQLSYRWHTEHLDFS